MEQLRKSIDRNKERRRNLDQLWSGIRMGRAEALSQLFCVSYSWLFNYGYKIVPKAGFVEDAIQELFCILWKKRSDINKAKSVKSYLFTSLRRIIFRRLKKQRNRAERNHNYKDHQFEDSYNREKRMIRIETDKEQKVEMQNAMESLSDRQWEAVQLKYFNGLSNTEIAQVMEINKQSVYNYISSAISKMQDQIQLS